MSTARSSVLPLTESGLLTALAVVFGLMTAYLPILGFLVAFLLPLPFIVLIVRHGFRQGLMGFVVALALLAMLSTPFYSLTILLTYGVPGLVLGRGFQKEWHPWRTFGLATIISIAAVLGALGLGFLMTGINPFTEQLEAYRSVFAETEATYAAMGVDTKASGADVKEVLSFMALLMPLSIAMVGVLSSAVGYALGARVLRHLGHRATKFPPFRLWRLPVAFFYTFGFALVGVYWGSTYSIELLYTVAVNVVIFTMLAGVVQGCSVLSFFMDRHRLGLLFRVAIYIFLFFNGVMLLLLSIAGLFDMAFDYRHRFAGE